MESNLRKKIISSLIWKFLERGGTQGIQFILQIILARILLPEDYGLVAIIMIFITIANVFVQSGFSIALIQKKKIDELDYSSVFYLSLSIATIVYIILYFVSPFIGKFYKNIELINILRVLSLTLFIGVFNSIQNTIIAKNMDFKKQFVSSFLAIILSGIIGVYLAFRNYGVWTLVYQQLFNQLLVCIILFKITKWYPKFIFSIVRIKTLFKFGSKLLLSSLLDTVYTNITNLIIGRIYPPAMLGYYNRGNQFPLLIVSNFNGSIQAVMFPTLSMEQDNKKRMKEIVRKSIMVSSYIIFPLMLGLIIIAEPLVKILLTEKWLPCVPYLRIFCLSYALWPIHTANLQAINSIGRSDIFLKLEIIKKIIGLLILVISINYGVLGIAFGVLISSILGSFINAYPNKKLLNYGYLEQINDIFSSLLLTILVGIFIFLISLLNIDNILLIILQIIVGTSLYILFSYLFNLDCYTFIIKILKNK